MATQIVEFNRPNNSISWGFAIQGGKEFGSPLTILKVTPGSIAHRLGVMVGDIIVSVNNERADVFTHSQAITKFKCEKVTLELKKPKSDNSSVLFPPPPPNIDLSKFDNSCRISVDSAALPPPLTQPGTKQQYTPTMDIKSQPTKPIMKEQYQTEIPRPKNVFQNRDSTPTNKFENIEKNVPSIVLDTKKLELFQKQLEQDKERTVDFASSLNKFIENKNNQPRDLNATMIQQTNQDKSSVICCVCHASVFGHYIEANKKIYCKNHFRCSFCEQPIQGNQFIESKEGSLYCMEDYKKNIAVKCSQCKTAIVEEQIVAIGKCFHPQCFTCHHCKQPIPGGNFHVKEENGTMLVYCERDYKDYYEIKCAACNFPIDNDDRYLKVANKNYHDNCFSR